MAGNKKPNRKKSIGKRETLESKFRIMNAGIAARVEKNAAVRERNMRLSQLPMGHPSNAYVIDMTFSPFDKMFDDQEKTGTHMFGDDGIAVMWVEREKCYTPIVEACFEIHAQFEFTGDECGWGDVPSGLLAYGAKLARGELITLQDTADARETVKWMRDRLAGISCIVWANSMRKMELQNLQESAV